MKIYRTLLFTVLFFLSSCNFQQREGQVAKREAELNQKEQDLLLKEQSLNIREAELSKKEHLDSSLNNVRNDSLVGNWKVQMTCTEATCPGSAVGDTKIEQWNITYTANQIVAKVILADKVVRIYSGIYTGNTIELVEDRQGTTAQPATKMVVRLQLKESTMQGQREIVRENGCRVVYAIQMEKQIS